MGLALWEGERLSRDTALHPPAQPLPMGWGLYDAQEANARQMELTKELSGAQLLQDRGPPS
eukprot:3078537-Pyramimonas_sp.AAC.1